MKNGTKIVDTKYVGDYKITIKFSDDTVNVFDYNSLVNFNHDEFRPLKDKSEFKKFRIVNNHTNIAWGEDWSMILPLKTIYSQSR